LSGDQCHHTFAGRGALLRVPPMSAVVMGPRSRRMSTTWRITVSSCGRRECVHRALFRRRAADHGHSSIGRTHIAWARYSNARAGRPQYAPSTASRPTGPSRE